ncbi:Multifunctional CCA protein [Halomonadaceae bacterium LMG 33818]|uniref:polynucleotide adenylyltransferase n=1 Tax=Cernens ardua TaxID=3402176 RepID=UPI003EDBBC6A
MSPTKDKATQGLDVYLVGGAVRDKLLDFPYHERDWVVVGATEEALLKRGFRRVGRDFPVFLHPETNEEYALARTERKFGRGYTGFKVDASPDVTLKEDLERRDLTINAIAEKEGQLTDPFYGQQDIEQRLLRHIGPAFVEDPLRILRIGRFLARYQSLGFQVAPETHQLIRLMAEQDELRDLAAERVWKETEKALLEKTPSAFFSLLAVDAALLPWWAEFSDKTWLHEALARLERAVKAGITSVAQRWALLVLDLDNTAQVALDERLKLPVAVRDTRRLIQFTYVALQELYDSTPDQQSEVLMTWCQQCDVWRRLQRLYELQPALEFLFPHYPWKFLFSTIEEAAAISPRAWVKEGLKGPEIGARLAHERIECFKRYFHSNPGPYLLEQ